MYVRLKKEREQYEIWKLVRRWIRYEWCPVLKSCLVLVNMRSLYCFPWYNKKNIPIGK